ncbi:hypothetical protein HHI36_022209 [Cryptolaemus montrouzieri]|uniref:Uncharacterized protein n=1 Tax=Cryptolaemus montrouzieri TaxID=559131 RepID=A0ABD2MZA3_9CUCU
MSQVPISRLFLNLYTIGLDKYKMTSSEVHAGLFAELNTLSKDDIIEVSITLTLPEKMINPIVTEYVKNLKLAFAQYTEYDEDNKNDSNSLFDPIINETVDKHVTGFIEDSQVDTSQGTHTTILYNFLKENTKLKNEWREKRIKILEFKIGVLEDTVVEIEKTDAYDSVMATLLPSLSYTT